VDGNPEKKKCGFETASEDPERQNSQFFASVFGLILKCKQLSSLVVSTKIKGFLGGQKVCYLTTQLSRPHRAFDQRMEISTEPCPMSLLLAKTVLLRQQSDQFGRVARPATKGNSLDSVAGIKVVS